MRQHFLSISGMLAAIIISSPVWADSDNSNDCERMHVQIGNLTQHACQLVNTNVIHGNLISSPPVTIPSGFAGAFDIKQSFFGPNVVLEYSCAGEHITFGSQQNYCFMGAGQITGSVVTVSANIRGTYTKEMGSYFWSKPGLINWVLS